MFEVIYQSAVSTVASLMRVAALFNRKIKLGVVGRDGLLEEMESGFQKLVNGRSVAWFHAASLGEFEQGRPVIEAYKAQFPNHFILLTFFSPSGYEVRKNYNGADYICYMPWDTASNARRFVEIVQPKIAFFIKYEFWHNYLTELKRSGARIISFSTIFRPDQIFFKKRGGFFKRMLYAFDHIFVQNQQSLALLHGIGVRHCSLAGDTRFDRVSAIAQHVKNLSEAADFRDNKFCLIVGSAWEADMQVLIPVLNHFRGALKAIVAPHEIHKDEIEQWRKSLKGKTLLYSELAIDIHSKEYDYLVIDNIGMLSSLYQYGDMAYIGGAFGSGLHNILEAATFGIPITFGNKRYHKFQEAVDLINRKGAVAVADKDDLIAVADQWISSPDTRKAAGNVNKNYIAEGVGSTALILSEVKKMLG
ncbi:3-deoxy-D-manno-octulosonic acid transferase [Dyadobacter chenwenxiniae]|uniref:3-deoxy-D-manno-octulosonic acid transferase n=1 Tax=Dyadobacter chenwenxiniae TaxID=2906456 RepID=A0A9X1TGS3_9BACT|nr:glycosyltransferase N-terminal domain-containing protein [Dyadobacter chenwenxiniae]MCF0063909.1 3-deoxy-D-manno-octulosonic acid transferase [Dyadobacter chenwenxiniae]UON82639.1 3-deoxy-D-manno-octulosonic acid transferase [Dyadobacter chenwenxiniae]